MNNDIRITAIGGGTGLSTMLRGLKLYTNRITAVVTVADDGGSSGILRNDFGMLPPGDIRNCLIALADTEPVIKQLFSYRFTEGTLAGHSFGNLFIAAMNNISDNFEDAIKKVSSVLSIAGKVLPVTGENVKLSAILQSGAVINGESAIGARSNGYDKIDRVFLTPSSPKPSDEVINAITSSDVIVLGPGSLYTSVIPNLLVDGVADAVKRSNALKILVCNIMTQMGETEGYTVYDHLEALEKHSYKDMVDFVIANSENIPASLVDRYAGENAHMIKIDSERFNGKTKLVQANLLLIEDEYIRHNFSRLARTIITLYRWHSEHNKS